MEKNVKNLNLDEFDPLSDVNSSSRRSASIRPARPPPPPPANRVKSATVSSVPDDVVTQSPQKDVTDVDGSVMSRRKHASLDHLSSFQDYSDTVALALNPSSVGNSSFMQATPGSNEMANQLMAGRDELMKVFMMKRQEDYMVKKSINVFAGTWNVNGQYPSERLHKWLAMDSTPPDVYLVGFQELDLSKEAMVFAESPREDEWISMVFEALHPKATYVMIKHIRLVGMMLLFFAKRQHRPHITDVVAHQVGTGLLGKMGNKGGVGIRFNFYNTSICTVNSHLAAHAEETARRNQDFHDICSRMRFDYRSVFQQDILLWVGDLNYRLDGIDSVHVKEMSDRKAYEKLYHHDQLKFQKGNRFVFDGFDEGVINFKPTYKYDPGTDNWDTSEKLRPPAWCDRVLWKENKENNDKKPRVRQIEYRSHPSLKLSDHKPVSSWFEIDVNVIDDTRYQKVYEEEVRRLDKMENDFLPSVELNKQAVDFGPVKFQRPSNCTVEISNTGQYPCKFEFIPKGDDKTFCQPWLTISKPKGILLPGESCPIEFEVYVNQTTAPVLNSGEEKLEDILVLHLVGGKDFFITINGDYLPSCVGTSLNTLCLMNKPIQHFDTEEIKRLNALSTNHIRRIETPVLAVPKELWKLMDHLYNHGKQQNELFQRPALHTEVQAVIEHLDTCLPTAADPLPGNNHCIAETLLILLSATPQPIIPYNFYEMCTSSDTIDHGTAVELIKKLPTVNRNIFNYLILFLQELLKYSDDNGLNVSSIADIFSGIILRLPVILKGSQDVHNRRQNARAFLELFLNNGIQ